MNEKLHKTIAFIFRIDSSLGSTFKVIWPSRSPCGLSRSPNFISS